MNAPVSLDAVRELHVEARTLEHRHGSSNPYSKFLFDHGRRPGRAEAAAIGLLMGARCRADDGSMQPPLTKAQRMFAKERRQRQKEFSDRFERMQALRQVVSLFAGDAGAASLVRDCRSHLVSGYGDLLNLVEPKK